MLNVGVIGLGRRALSMLDCMSVFGIPFRVAAVADPRGREILDTLADPRAARDARLAVPPAGTMEGAVVCPDADALVGTPGLDGIMVATRCSLHAEMAAKAARRNIPLFVEKPVAISFEQIRLLREAFRGFDAPSVVSHPLRVTPVAETVAGLLASGRIGPVEHVVAVNDVPYGTVYFNDWYRNYDEMGGLFLQKATHDFDCIFHLLDDRPRRVCAMTSRRVFGGDKPFSLRCRDCAEQETCLESPFNLFHRRFQGERVDRNDWQRCVFAAGIGNEDSGNAIIEMESGVQVSYTQNFFVRHERVARRGARLYGRGGTIDFDWYRNTVVVYDHVMPRVETIDFAGGMPHFGGDRELALDFLMAMRDRRPSRSPIEAGIVSALACLWARESAAAGRFCDIVFP